MYTIGSSRWARIRRSCASSCTQLYAGSVGLAGLKPEGLVTGAIRLQKSGTLIALAPAAFALVSAASASVPMKASGSTNAVSSGRSERGAAVDDAARVNSARHTAVLAIIFTARACPAASLGLPVEVGAAVERHLEPCRTRQRVPNPIGQDRAAPPRRLHATPSHLHRRRQSAIMLPTRLRS